jgi:hypothetical protein
VEAPTADNADLKDWAKKKGIDWTSDDSILAALKKSDQEFHKRQAERKAAEQKNPGFVQPAYTPPPPIPQGYQNQTLAQRQLLENVARQYNMPVEDAERLMAFNRDFFEAMSRPERERQEREIELIKRENQKNSVFRELASDPVLKKPEVALEFNKVIAAMQVEDPQSFEQDPNVYTRALDKTLLIIARRNLQGQPLEEGVPPVARLPTNPPPQRGGNSGGGASENEAGIDPVAFARMSLDDKKKVLEKAGLRAAY